MDLTHKPRRKTDYRLELVDNEMMLYHPADDKIIHLNQPASLIWQLCDGETPVEKMIFLLQEAYPDAEDEIAEDVQTALDQLFAAGCIETA